MTSLPGGSRHATSERSGRHRRVAATLLVGMLAVGGLTGAAAVGRAVLSRPGPRAPAGSGSEPGGIVPSGGWAGAAAMAATSGAAATSGVGATAGAVATEVPSAVAGSPSGTAGADPSGLTTQDRLAGLRSAGVPQRGTGRLAVVPGTAEAPGRGTVKRVRVEVEGGLDIDGAAFASFVMATLNDPRSWGHGGRLTFARTSGKADIRVVLVSPRTSVQLCAPLRTMGTLSCGTGNTAVLTLYRWVKAIPGYGDDRTGYRRYVVNHEVGHTLGHGHLPCPGPGRVAPVMMQQTKGLQGCRPNGWPYP
jgi:hypothetical protein